ncbi:hypothetical protein [Methanohalophilus sp.]|nr:hypothetical protein [Methanohalophilus sp.]
MVEKTKMLHEDLVCPSKMDSMSNSMYYYDSDMKSIGGHKSFCTIG